MYQALHLLLSSHFSSPPLTLPLLLSFLLLFSHSNTQTPRGTQLNDTTRRVQKEDKKERVNGSEAAPLTLLSKKEKALRAMRKKLGAINALIELQKSGTELDFQQLKKLETLDTVMGEMEAIMADDTS
jgi:uncharacterized protein with WD repeat